MEIEEKQEVMASQGSGHDQCGSRDEPTVGATAALANLHWPEGKFWVHDPEPDNHHGALYLVFPGGLSVNVSCDAREGVDIARANWIAETLNTALAQFDPDWTKGPFSSVHEAHDKRVLLLASYCGGDSQECTEDRPCGDCLSMDNVALVRGRIKVLGGLDYLTLGAAAATMPETGTEQVAAQVEDAGSREALKTDLATARDRIAELEGAIEWFRLTRTDPTLSHEQEGAADALIALLSTTQPKDSGAMMDTDREREIWLARQKRDSWSDAAGFHSAGLFVAAIFIPSFGPWPVAVVGIGFALCWFRVSVWAARISKLQNDS